MLAINLKMKIMAWAGLLACASVLTTAVLLGSMSAKKVEQGVAQLRENQLIATRDMTQRALEFYLTTVRSKLLAFAHNEMVVSAMSDFKSHYKSVSYSGSNSESNSDNDGEMKAAVEKFYTSVFSKKYLRSNRTSPIDVSKIIQKLDKESILLQYHYIVKNASELEDRKKLDAANDTSEYTKAHKKYHANFRYFMEKFGFKDIYLVDGETGDVVYSVNKSVDYTTALIGGPFSDSGIGKAYLATLTSTDKEWIAFSDFSPYAPYLGRPAAFLATPVYLSNIKIGVLIFQMPVDKINEIMTHGGKWHQSGLGKSGETYLVGPDYKARSVSRFLVEDIDGFINDVSKAGTSRSVIDKMVSNGTNIGIQEIRTKGAEEALAGNTGFLRFTDYRGEEVLSAYAPINIEGKRWALLSEIDVEEAFSNSRLLKRSIIYSALAIAFIIAIFGVILGALVAFRVVTPINLIVNSLEDIADGEGDLTKRLNDDRGDELGNLAGAFNKFAGKIRSIIKNVDTVTHELAVAAETMIGVMQVSSEGTSKQRIQTDRAVSSISQMTSSVQEVAGNAALADTASKEADKSVNIGVEEVGRTSDAVVGVAHEVERAALVIQRLESDSENIGSVIDVIRSIADQTNLLALNAAIEAARAGEQGRGFAVVADEVRTLASKTQDSTSEIHAMIEALQGGIQEAATAMKSGTAQVAQSVDQASRAREALGIIAEAVESIRNLNSSIATAAEEQSQVAKEINNSVVEINQISARSASELDRSTVSVNKVAELSEQLQGLVEQFRV